MVNLSDCPAREDLRRFAVGDLTGAEAETVEQHLDVCERCLETLHVEESGDTLVDSLRGPSAAQPAVPDELVENMVQRIGLLRQSSPRAPQGPGIGDERASQRTDDFNTPAVDRGIDTPTTGTEQLTGDVSAAEDLDFLAPAEQPGELGRLGAYRVLQVLGSGGMGVVFVAEDPQLQRRVALKVMRASLAASKTARQRFLREARLAAKIEHDHLVHIYQVGEDRGMPFLAMQLLKGESLEERLRREKRLPVADAIRIGREIAEGLAAAHGQGLIHRDIKPANVWLEKRDEPQRHRDTEKTERGFATIERTMPSLCLGVSVVSSLFRVKILDFGLARAVEDDAHITGSGVIAGTPAYMAPEQARAEAVDERTDLFSLGCVLYRMLVGRTPFRGENTTATLYSLANDEPAAPADVNPAVPKELSDYVQRLLAKKAGDRPGSAREVVEMLEKIERTAADAASVGGQHAIPDTTTKTTTPTAQHADTSCVGYRRAANRSRRWLVAAAVLLLLVPLSYFFGGTVLRIATNKGELVIETDDRDVEVVVKHGGAKPEIHLLNRQDPKRTLVLRPGDYEIEVTEKPNGLHFFTKQLTLRRGGKETVKVWLEPMQAKAALPTGGDPDRRAAEWALSIGSTISITENGKERAIPAVGDLPRGAFELTAVDLNNNPKVTNAGLANFKDCKNLTGLTLHHTQVSNAGLVHFQDCKNLAVLNLAYTIVSDAGLAHFKDCKNLTNLNLYHTEVSDAALAHFKDYRNLMILVLYETQVSDAGLTHLKDLKNLARLDLQKTKVTSAGIGELKKALPLCKIEWDGGVIEPQTASPLDALDPAQIPASEQFPSWQPKELVAVIGEHRQRHWGQIMSLAMSPDGKQVATGGHNGQIRRWDLATQRELPGMHFGPPVYLLAYSPDGKRLACGGASLVQLWDVGGAKPKLHTVVTDEAGVYYCSMAFAPDGKSLVYHCPIADEKKGGVWLWDLSEPRPRLRARYPKGSAASFSPDGKTLAFIHEDRSIGLCDLAEMEPKQRAVLPSKEGKSHGFTDWRELDFAPDGRLATIGIGPDQNLRLWDVSGPEPKLSATIKKRTDQSFVAFAAKAKRMVTAGNDLQLWKQDGLDYVLMAGVSAQGRGLVGKLSPDGNTLVTGEPNGAVRFWRVADDSLVEQDPVKPQTIAGVGFFLIVLPHGPALATTAEDLKVHVWRFGGAAPIEATFLGNWPPKGRHLAATRDGKTLATGDENNPVQLWHAEGTKFREAEILKAHKLSAGLSAFSPDGKTLAKADTEKISLWDFSGATPKETSTVVAGKGHIQSLTFSPDGRRLYSFAAYDNCVRLWDVADGKLDEKARIDDCGVAFAVSPDGKTLASAHGGIEFWDLTEDKPRKRLPWLAEHYLTTVAFSPDGRTVVATGGTAVIIGEVATGRKLREWTFPGVVRWAAYAPDGRHLFTANSNGTIYVLRLEEKSPAIFAAADPDRRVAEWVLGLGGEVEIEGEAARISASAQLPRGPFKIVVLRFGKGAGLIDDAALENLRDITSLEQLYLDHCAITDAAVPRLVAIPGLKRLRFLNLDYTRVGDASLRHLKQIAELEQLLLYGTKATNAGMKDLRAMPRLRDLNLGNTAVTAAALAELSDLKLNSLSLEGMSGIDVAASKRLGAMTSLTNLILARTDIADAALDALRPLRSLRDLNLKKTDVSADGIKKLAMALPKCKIDSDHGIFGPKTPVADTRDRETAAWVLQKGGAVWAWIGNNAESSPVKSEPLPGAFFIQRIDLRVLHLTQTKLTDGGVDALARLRRLEWLTLAGTPISSAGVKRLVAALPMCKIESDHGTFGPK